MPAGETTTLTATLNITDNLTITGNGHIISGNETVRVMSATANLTLNNVTIRDGKTSGLGQPGAGLFLNNGGAASAPTLTINNSAFINNVAGTRAEINAGGAISTTNAGQINITNSTFSGNAAYEGGALSIRIAAGSSSRPTANLIHLTISNTNSYSNTGSAIDFEGTQRGAIRNSIIANHINGQACEGQATITNSIIEGTNQCGGSPITSDPQLGSLTGNYYLLLDTSPAIGAGNATYCTASDQIGNMRPIPTGSNCDIGAIESARGMPLPTDTPVPSDNLPTATLTPTATPTHTAIADRDADRNRDTRAG